MRKHLASLYKDVEEKLEILSVSTRFNPTGAFNHIDLLYEVIIPLLQSPLAAKAAFGPYAAFRDAFFEPSDDYLRMLLSYYINLLAFR